MFLKKRERLVSQAQEGQSRGAWPQHLSSSPRVYLRPIEQSVDTSCVGNSSRCCTSSWRDNKHWVELDTSLGIRSAAQRDSNWAIHRYSMHPRWTIHFSLFRNRPSTCFVLHARRNSEPDRGWHSKRKPSIVTRLVHAWWICGPLLVPKGIMVQRPYLTFYL